MPFEPDRPVGVLALQGGFQAHLAMLRGAGLSAREVRAPKELEGLGGLVLPGGESTTQHQLITRAQLEAPLSALVKSGRPVLATCAGLILCARYGWLDVEVRRNAYGSQVHSFEACDDLGAMPLVFIRAPRLGRVGPLVEVLATFEGEPVLVRQQNVLAACFHPELSGAAGAQGVLSHLRSLAAAA